MRIGCSEETCTSRGYAMFRGKTDDSFGARKSVYRRAAAQGWASFFASVIVAVMLPSCSKDENPNSPLIDETPPRILSIDPADGSSYVSPAAGITVRFSESMDPLSVNEETFRIEGIASTVSSDAAVAVCRPKQLLERNCLYTVRIARDVKDLAGNALAAEFASTFRVCKGLVADAGSNAIVNCGDRVSLNGTGSHDLDSLAFSFSWRQVSGMSVSLDGSQAERPSFTASNRVGTVGFVLCVSNGIDESVDTVYVTALRDTAKAVFVSTWGSDANAGTVRAPLATIQAGIQKAASRGRGWDVYVAGGNYFESTLALAENIGIYGGFRYNGTADWVHDIVRSRTILIGGETAVRGVGVSNITIDGLCIRSAAGSVGQPNSIGISLHHCSNIAIARSEVMAAGGASGGSGQDRLRAASGEPGSNGAAGKCCSFGAVCELVGGGGGQTGGYCGGWGGGSGTVYSNAGAQGCGPSGGQGGAAGVSGVYGGTFGGTGSNGYSYAGRPRAADGAGGLSIGSIIAGAYMPADGKAGSAGISGSGGGGGGGGGGCTWWGNNCTGGSGGGGGSGGAGGAAGPPGAGGGASLGILLTGSSTLTISETIITTQRGGNGGNGGGGGEGGDGAAGGSGGARKLVGSDIFGSYYTGGGGSGGAGGKGQDAGHGGGGGGGASICLLWDASSDAIINDQCEEQWDCPSIGGAGGRAGGSSACHGAPGFAARKRMHEGM